MNDTILQIDFPARYASALINHDFSSSVLDEDDIEDIERILSEYVILSVSDEEFIGSYNVFIGDTMLTFSCICKQKRF